MAVQPELHLDAHQLAVNLLKRGAPPAGGVGRGGKGVTGGEQVATAQGGRGKLHGRQQSCNSRGSAEEAIGRAGFCTEQAAGAARAAQAPHPGSWCQQRSARRRYGSGQSSRNSGRSAPSARQEGGHGSGTGCQAGAPPPRGSCKTQRLVPRTRSSALLHAAVEAA